MATFTWYPQTAADTTQPRVLTAPFGDGYEQRAGDGINTMPVKWSLTFNAITADIDAIKAFLVARAGVEAFDWVDPNGNSIKVVCRQWGGNITNPVVGGLSATFEQVYGA